MYNVNAPTHYSNASSYAGFRPVAKENAKAHANIHANTLAHCKGMIILVYELTADVTRLAGLSALHKSRFQWNVSSNHHHGIELMLTCCLP